MNYWHWIFERVRRQLWWRAVAFGIAGMFTAVLALVVEKVFPWEIPFNLSPDAVDSLLNIIASSMLAVTTFSLGVMTAAFGAATTNVTPRDGAGLIEVQLRLQKSLAALQRQGSQRFRQAAAAQSALALQRSEQALTCEADRLRLHEMVEGVGQ